MSGFPILTALVITPIAGAILLAIVPSRRVELIRVVAFVATMTTGGFAGALAWSFRGAAPGFQFVEDHAWIDALGVRYVLGADGISLTMLALTGLLFPIAILASTGVTERVKAYMIVLLVLEAGVMGVFVALDLVLFFVFWEVMLIPMYFLIGGWGHERRVYAAMKFFIYTMAGSALLLAGILGVAFLHARGTGGPLTFDLRTLMAWDGLGAGPERWLFLAFFASFAIKVPLFPFHTWLPDAHTEAPTAGSVILAGVLLKMGVYGFLRFSLTLFPGASLDLAPFMLTLAVIGIIYGAVVATMQSDLKRLVAYSSVAHMGFIVLGIFALTSEGLAGGVFTMVSHGLTTGALFLLVGMLYERRHTREISEFGGLWKSTPLLGGAFCVATFASIGLPGFSGFIGELLAMAGTFVGHPGFAAVAALGVVLSAVYLLWAFQRVFTGEPTALNASLPDMSLREVLTVAPLLILSLVIGVYPRPILERVQPTLDALVVHVEERTGYHQPEVGPNNEPIEAHDGAEGGGH